MDSGAIHYDSGTSLQVWLAKLALKKAKCFLESSYVSGLLRITGNCKLPKCSANNINISLYVTKYYYYLLVDMEIIISHTHTYTHTQISIKEKKYKYKYFLKLNIIIKTNIFP